jgi:hypothetical protein
VCRTQKNKGVLRNLGVFLKKMNVSDGQTKGNGTENFTNAM